MSKRFLSIYVLLTIGVVFVFGSHIGYRLSTRVKPSFYTLKIRPDLDKGTFKGDVSIHFLVEDFIDSLVLHSDGLTIQDVYIDQQQQINVQLHKQYTLLEIVCNNGSQIAPGQHFLRISYHGSLLNKTLGFFKADNGRANSELAVTDFQPTYARRAFPCFDEPAFKAQFQVSVVTPNSSFFALSNMAEIGHFESNEGVVYQFKTTCVQSTYLVAFAVTKYPFGQLLTKNISIRTYAFGANNTASFSVLNDAKEAFEFFTEYTNYPNPITKIDMIEYNRDQSGATENWGLITFRTGLLSPYSKIYDEFQIRNIISHEIAHYWIGNLVTNYWWDDIWLQEGFAVFLSIKVEEKHSPHAMISFGNDFLDDIFLQDHKPYSLPLVTTLENHKDIERKFNDVTYNKGASIFRTLENVLGEEAFRKGLHKYLCRFAYQTVTTNDFIRVFETIDSSVNIRGFIESHVYQSNYPIIEISEEASNYVLRQRSCVDGNTNDRWAIPVSYVTSLDMKNRTLTWFDRAMDSLKIAKGKESWMKLNYQQMGYYRTNYSESLWNKLILNSQYMESFEREHLLSEAVQLYQADVISCSRVFHYMEKLSRAGAKFLPIIPASVFLTHLSDDYLEQYDKDTFEKTLVYVKTLLRNSGHKIERRRRKSSIYTNNAIKTPQRLISCAAWIKENIRVSNEDMNEI